MKIAEEVCMVESLDRRTRLAQAVRTVGFPANLWHVIPVGEGWVVRREKAARATKAFDSRRAAIDRARQLARNADGELIVHHKDGTIQSYTRVVDGAFQDLLANGKGIHGSHGSAGAGRDG